MDNKARDFIVLAMEAFRSGQIEGSAKFFAEAMQSDDLDSFVDFIGRKSEDSALHGTTSDNTISPSLKSESSEDDSNEVADLSDIIDELNEAFASEQVDRRIRTPHPGVDEDDGELEAEASDEDNTEVEETNTEETPTGYKLKLTAKAGPVGVK